MSSFLVLANSHLTSVFMQIFDFIGSDGGDWHVTNITPVVGNSIAPFSTLRIVEGSLASYTPASWFTKGVRSNMRYTIQSESTTLTAAQASLGRAEATCAALIPIKKSDAWWALAQDERRHIFEEQSRHIGIGLAYLPAIARRLYHSRDLVQEFDFLTWFEYAPEHQALFEELVQALRSTAEWNFVTRETDIRLTRMAR
jgi:chlorite dismutase